MRSVIITILFLFSVGCSSDVCRESAIETAEVTVEVDRLERELFKCQSVKEVSALLKENPAFSRIFLQSDQYPSDGILANKLFGLINDPSIDTLYQEVQDAYPSMDFLVADLQTALGKLKTLYPEVNGPLVQTAFTGLFNDLFISDSLIIIGLDFFAGEEASYRPTDIPIYILNRYDRAHLSSVIMKFIAGGYVQSDKSETLLSEMIDFGKTYYLVSQLLPCTPDSILIGYSSEEIATAEANEAMIWANFVENEVLYETSHVTKRRFLGERPNVYEISQQCPGRIGAWVGWQIVREYMEENDVSIQELLQNTDNQAIFTLSGYKPQSR